MVQVTKDPGPPKRMPDMEIEREFCPWCAKVVSEEDSLLDEDERLWHLRCAITACALLPSKTLADFDLMDWLRSGIVMLKRQPPELRRAVLDQLSKDIFEEGSR